MTTSKVTIGNTWSFLSLLLTFSALAAGVLIFGEKGDVVKFFMEYRPSYLFIFFSKITLIAEDYFVIIIGVIIAAFSIKYSFIYFFNYLLSGAVAQVFKKLIFPSRVRPMGYFNDIPPEQLQDLKVLLMQSFPSGHTTVAFAMFFTTCLLVKNQLLKVLFFTIALLIGVSRIFLILHFTEDVLAGAWIGVLMSALGFIIWDNHSIFEKKPFLSRGLVALTKS